MKRRAKELQLAKREARKGGKGGGFTGGFGGGFGSGDFTRGTAVETLPMAETQRPSYTAPRSVCVCVCVCVCMYVCVCVCVCV